MDAPQFNDPHAIMPETSSCQTLYGHTLHFFHDDFIGRKVAREGVYEKEVLAFLTTLLTVVDHATVLDIGANIGNHSLAFATAARQVYAFEPIPQIFALLEKNIHGNHIDNIHAVNIACSNTSGEATIYLSKNGNAGGSGFDRDEQGNEPVTVSKQTGDELVSQLETGPVDLIKIDVEGHEYPVLQGLQKTITEQQPFVLLEWADENTRQQLTDNRVLETLFAGYDIKVLGSNHDKQYWAGKPLGKWRRKLEQLLRRKKTRISPFYAGTRYDNILLIPASRQAAFERACQLMA